MKGSQKLLTKVLYCDWVVGPQGYTAENPTFAPGFHFLPLKLLGPGKVLTKQFPSVLGTKKERKEPAVKTRKLRTEPIAEEKRRKERTEKERSRKLTREEEKKAKKPAELARVCAARTAQPPLGQ